MKSLPSRRFSRFGVSRSAGRSGSTAAAQSEGGADTTVSASQSEVVASPSTILNDGSTTSTITVTLRNASGVPLSGKTITLSSTGSNNTIVQPGTTNGSGVATGTIATTTAESKTITAVSEGITVTDTATVTSTTALTPIFQSDFSTATGTGSSAYLDGGAWDRRGGFGQEVVASTGLDFPSTNVCRFDANYSNSGFCLTQVDLTALAVGVTRYHRLYVRMTFPDDLVGNGDHPWQDGNAVGDSNYLLGVSYGSAVDSPDPSAWQPNVLIIEDGGTISCRGPWLSKGTTYRIEWSVERIDTATYNFDIRVYDTSGTLLYDSTDFVPEFGGGTLATRGPYDFKTAQQASPGDYFNCGTNDFETAGNDWWISADPFTYGYQGCFAICEDQGWIGAYGSVTGE